ncbi:MAG: RNA polymerase sigma-70 factor [Gemmatimonadaceae bacterium]
MTVLSLVMEPDQSSQREEFLPAEGAAREGASSDDRVLLQALRAGDEKAFEAVFRRWYAPLVRLAESLTRSRARGEEIVQDVMLELWRRRDTLAADGSPQAYLFQSTRNRSLNDIRHERVKERGEPHVIAATAPFGPAADARLEEGEIDVALREAMEDLPERSRIVFEMSRVQGLKYSEIADSLGISIKTVEAHMGKALRHLRERMAHWLPAGRRFGVSHASAPPATDPGRISPQRGS